MNMPGFTATASLGASSILYKGEVDPNGRSRGTIVPADNCDSVDCDIAQKICFATLDLDPVSCGLYYGCCYGKPSEPVAGTSDCRNQPCDPGCPSDLCIQSMGSALSSTSELSSTSNLSSQIATLGQQVKRIARCACGLPPLTVPYVPPHYVPPRYIPPHLTVPYMRGYVPPVSSSPQRIFGR